MSGELRRAVQRRTWRSCVVLIASDRRAAIGHLQAIASSIGCRPFTVPRRRRSWDILHQARQELLIAGRWVTGHLSSAILRFPRRVLPAGGGRTSTTALTGPWPAEHRSLLRIRTAQGQRALFFCRPEGVRGPVSALLGRRACRHVAVFSVHRRRRAGRHRRRRGQRGCAAHLCAVLERLGGRPGAAPPPRRRRRLVLSGDQITSVVRRRSAARRHSARHRIGQATHLAERRRVLVPVRSLEAPWPEIAAPPLDRRECASRFVSLLGWPRAAIRTSTAFRPAAVARVGDGGAGEVRGAGEWMAPRAGYAWFLPSAPHRCRLCRRPEGRAGGNARR